MIIFKKIFHLQEWIKARKHEGLTIGFVPTMGALHQGHLSLAEGSKDECDITIFSIFVNPRQFNDPQDLLKYPRPIEDDIHLLLKNDIDVLFLPDVDEIYPSDQNLSLDFDPGTLGSVMEGKFRPGHFAGVAEVMYRLLTIVESDRLYMGQKDFQQVAIVRKLIMDKNLHVNLIMCPTLREPNGLAMSSRNLRLSPQARIDAALIYTTLIEGRKDFEEDMPEHRIKEKAMDALTRKDFKPEYFSIVDGNDLHDIENKKDSLFVVACCAVNVEGVRLIDNLIWKK